MATMTLKSTFTLDRDTNEAIRNLALNWKVSQAEVVRKSIQIAMNEVAANKARSPLAILASLEKKKKTTPKEIAAFKKVVEENKKGWDF
ncbi:MAG TPA: hypothetical protein PLX69_23165 [Leptospiraceae bacterium]|nr:hypothetical protein [Leptospiraceae bacterium]HRG77479.1 hypothetical protein [Leptospiraceae bacterium]